MQKITDAKNQSHDISNLKEKKSHDSEDTDDDKPKESTKVMYSHIF